MAWWRQKAYECPLCGWQGMREPAWWGYADCPECGEHLTQRSWMDTWGLTLLILGVVMGVVLLVVYGSQFRAFME